MQISRFGYLIGLRPKAKAPTATRFVQNDTMRRAVTKDAATRAAAPAPKKCVDAPAPKLTTRTEPVRTFNHLRPAAFVKDIKVHELTTGGDFDHLLGHRGRHAARQAVATDVAGSVIEAHYRARGEKPPAQLDRGAPQPYRGKVTGDQILAAAKRIGLA